MEKHMHIYPPDAEDILQVLEAADYAQHPALPDEIYERTVRLAAVLLHARYAAVSLIGADRTWLKAQIGFPQQGTDSHLVFCSQTLVHNDVHVVEDAAKDPRFMETAASPSQPCSRFYAGVPLRMSTGENIGTLCVLDDAPKEIRADQKQALVELAATLTGKLEALVIGAHREIVKSSFLDALNSLPSGFAVFDMQDNLVACNAQYWALLPELHGKIVAGSKFEHILSHAVAAGCFPEASGNEENWIASFMGSQRGTGQRHSHCLQNGKWVGFQEKRTDNGGIVAFSYDLTDLKNHELELSRLAWTDNLTGCLNRHRFIELTNAEIERMRRNEASACLLMLDADHFKQVNDGYGHAAGDAVLKGLAQRWQDQLRSHDLLGRIGGEEFCIMLPETSIEGGQIVAERLRKTIAELPFAHDGQLLRVTVSIGLTKLNEGDDLDSWMQRADLALYEAKESGRDRFIMRAA